MFGPVSGGSTVELRPYQAEVLQFAEQSSGRFIYADAAGTGKTPTTSALLAAASIRRPALVVAPGGVIDHWLDEIRLWTPYRAVDGRGTPKQRAEARAALTAPGEPPAVLVVNYDLMRRDRDELIQVGPFDAFVADEAHRLKGRTNPTAVAAGMISRRATLTALLTGTPVLNRPEELFALLQMVAPKQYPSYWRWAYSHFEVEATDFHGHSEHAVRIVGDLLPGHDVLIRAETAEVMIARDIDTLLPDLPKVTNHIVPVELSEAEREAYDHMSKKGWAHVDGQLVETSNKVSRLTRLRQMSSDWSGLVEGSGISLGAKVDAALQLLDTDRQVVVLAAFKAPVDRLMENLHSAVRYDGTVTLRNRRKAVAAFRSGDAQFIVGTIAAMGEGLDGLQVADSLIRLDRDFTPARNEQVIARVRRSGQHSDRVHVVDLVAADTTDEWIADMLAHKTAGIDRVRIG